ncbi:MAG TPA: hypothetical protein VMS38_02230 [Pseudorhodoferax sp.]|nr:hypothetical protein [Pseudorhodoferax sp.]
MPKVLTDLALWSSQFAALYAWKVLGIEGAGNLLTALITALLVLALLSVLLLDIKKPYKKLKGLPRWITRSLSLGLFGVLVWFGHGWLAAMYGTATVLLIALHVAWSAKHDKRQAQAA